MKNFDLKVILMGFSVILFISYSYAGQLSPTIYYIKSVSLDQECTSKKSILGVDGQTLFKVCKDAYKKCVIEGTCAIMKSDAELLDLQISENKSIDEASELKQVVVADDEISLSISSDLTQVDPVSTEPTFEVINYVKQNQSGTPLFMPVDEASCPWGYGVSAICLDPYYTVAADMSYHKAGDVIFVNKLKGVKLPTGEVHNGFLIVRDRGGAIKGADRFDFYTGILDYRDEKNPFTPFGFATSSNKLEYRKATAAETLATRKARNFPKIPVVQNLKTP